MMNIDLNGEVKGKMWYVIRTQRGYEEAVRQQVKKMLPKEISDGCMELYCVRKKRYLGKWHDEIERFLPGYLFLVIDNSRDKGIKLEIDRKMTKNHQANECIAGCRISELLDTFGCKDKFGPVRSDEEEFLKKLTSGREEIGMSYGVIRDGILEISEGALVGMESRVRRIDRHKRMGYLAMEIHGEEIMAQIGLEITEKFGFA